MENGLPVPLDFSHLLAHKDTSNRTSIGQNETKQDKLRQIFHIRYILTPYISILFLNSKLKIKKTGQNRTKRDIYHKTPFSQWEKGRG
ncbi:MAG: hypothetical protein A2475_06175 [Ignavibacteria bacterium RIFOXYC2_FULL_35_21]|nr:MAG: hypothetical protein A2X63_05605 [Ignavibacteria bacterium GWA2_35_8]OGV23510.1 MAG: hypothetical protein A2475_06175 [Ignavibacteria bacterium RIFOXYC2_FULL_35_21]